MELKEGQIFYAADIDIIFAINRVEQLNHPGFEGKILTNTILNNDLDDPGLVRVVNIESQLPDNIFYIGNM